jgi:hypothetical protein
MFSGALTRSFPRPLCAYGLINILSPSCRILSRSSRWRFLVCCPKTPSDSLASTVFVSSKAIRTPTPKTLPVVMISLAMALGKARVAILTRGGMESVGTSRGRGSMGTDFNMKLHSLPWSAKLRAWGHLFPEDIPPSLHCLRCS